MNTIQSEWELFAKMAIPANAPQEQIKTMRRCFYAGAASFLHLQMAITDDSVSDDAGVNIYAGLVQELSGFVDLVNVGRA